MYGGNREPYAIDPTVSFSGRNATATVTGPPTRPNRPQRTPTPPVDYVDMDSTGQPQYTAPQPGFKPCSDFAIPATPPSPKPSTSQLQPSVPLRDIVEVADIFKRTTELPPGK